MKNMNKNETTGRDATLLGIARETLHLETLDTRRSDGLDFSDQAVWQIKAALEAAYEAGRASVVHETHGRTYSAQLDAKQVLKRKRA